MARPPANRRSIIATRASIIEAVKTPIGFFALVVLAVEAMTAAMLPFVDMSQRLYVVGGMLGILLIMILIVAMIAHQDRALDEGSSSFAVILLPPPNIPGFNLHDIEWLQSECKILAGNLEMAAQVGLAGQSGSVEVRIGSEFLRKIGPTTSLLIKLVDTKMLRWEAGPFYPQQATQPLRVRERKDEVLQIYGIDQ